MEFLCLAGVFLAIVVLLTLRRPMYQAILGGIVAALVLYRIPLREWVAQPAEVLGTWSSFSVILSLYLITYLQRLLESRQMIRRAQADLDGLFHNRRINAAVAPMFIGLMPSAAAMILCGDIVRDSTEGYMEPGEQAVVTNWFRHIPESTLPTYTGVLLMTQLSGVPMAEFLVGMIVPTAVLIGIGYVFHLRKLPKDPGTPPSENRRLDALHLVQHLWPLFLIVVLILAFRVPVVLSLLTAIVLAAVSFRSSGRELCRMLLSAVEPRLLGNTFLVLTLKEFIDYTGVLQLVPEALKTLPIPPYLVFAILFFIGPIISGSAGTIAMGTALAFSEVGGGMPLMVLLMCMVHASMQLSPTHVCLAVASDYFGVSLGRLIRGTVPMSLLFAALMIGYYQLLLLL